MKAEPTKISNETKKIVERFYAALFEKDLEAIASLFSDEVDWFVAGHEKLAPWLGQRNNRRQVKEFFELLSENVELLDAQIQHILADGDFAVATGEFTSRMLGTGKIYESVFSAHFTVRDNLIVRYRLLEDSYGLVRALSD